MTPSPVPADDNIRPDYVHPTAVRPARRRSPMPPGSLIASDHEALKHLAGLVGDCSDDAVLWVTFLSADDRALALVLPIDELPSMPDDATTVALAAAMRDVVGKVYPGAQALVAIVRPTGGDYGDHECLWADALWRAADATGWSIRMIAAVGADRSRVLDRARCIPHADLR